MTKFTNSEFLFGYLEAARYAAEAEAIELVDGGLPETSDEVVALDRIVTAIEAFQAEFEFEEAR